MDAGREALDRGLHREAADAFTDADELVAGRLETADLVRWAVAADRAGLDAHDLRARAFDRALAEGDGPASFAAAMAGLPESEPQGGDARRVTMLAAVDPDTLPSGDQFRLAAELGRQYALLGRVISSRKVLSEARSLASNAQQRVDLASLQRLVDFETRSPEERLATLPTPDSSVSTHSTARLHLLQAFDHLSAGDLSSSVAAADAAAALLDLDDSPLLRWWLLLTRSTHAWTAGSFAAARALSEEARVHGLHFGLRNGSAAWVGQQWSMARAFGPVPELAAVVGTLPPDVSSSPVARAGVTILRLDAANSPAARRALDPEIRDHAMEALEGAGHTGLVIVALLARHLDQGDRELMEAARSLLWPQRGSWIIFGTGVFVQGPADLALADLHTGADRHDLLEETLRTADAFDAPPWQAIVRLELARRGLGRHLVDEAMEIARGTEFESSIVL